MQAHQDEPWDHRCCPGAGRSSRTTAPLTPILPVDGDRESRSYFGRSHDARPHVDMGRSASGTATAIDSGPTAVIASARSAMRRCSIATAYT